MSNYSWGTHDYLNEDEREAEEERAYYAANTTAATAGMVGETAPDNASTTAQMSHELLSEGGGEAHEEVKLGDDAEHYHDYNHTASGEHGKEGGDDAGVEQLVNEIASAALNHAGGWWWVGWGLVGSVLAQYYWVMRSSGWGL